MDVAYIIKSVDCFLKSEGFSKRGVLYYKYDNIALFGVLFDSPGLLWCSYFVMPFFMPFEVVVLTYGDRINTVFYSTDKRPSEDIITQWAKSFEKEYYSVISPFFEGFQTVLSNQRSITSCPKCCCSYLQLAKLRIFYYMYNSDVQKAKKELSLYSKMIHKEKALHTGVINREEKLIEELNKILACGKKEVEGYIETIVHNTKHVLKIDLEKSC